MALRAEGNEHFQAGRLEDALAAYTKALADEEPDRHLMLSNRAAAYLKMGNPEGALEDARAAVAADPTGGRWTKGLYRLAVALEANLRYREAYDIARTAASLPEADGSPEIRRLAAGLEPKSRFVTQEECVQLVGKCLGECFGSGSIGTLHLDYKAFKRYTYLERVHEDPELIEQVFGPYAAPADMCCGPRCHEEGQVRFYHFPAAADAGVIALRRFVEEGLCYSCQRRTPEKGRKKKVDLPSKKVEAVLVCKENFVLKQLTVDLAVLEGKHADGWLEKHECEIPNTLLGLDLQAYCRVWSAYDDPIPRQNNEIGTFAIAKFQTGFASHKVLGEVVIVRKSGRPLNEIQAHNILLLCLEMMDVYGDQGNLNKELKRHAKNFTHLFRILTGQANPDPERLLWAMGLYRADMDAMQLGEAARAAEEAAKQNNNEG